MKTRQGSASSNVALVIDWLDQIGGAEQVLLALHEMYPKAPIYTSVYRPKKLGNYLKNADIRTGYLNYFPVALRRFLGPLRQSWFSHLDLSNYDLVISVTGAEGKAVKTRPKNVPRGESSGGHYCYHLCYCHVPTQYYWQLYDDYLKNPGFGILNPLARLGLKLFVKPMRKKDFEAAERPDEIITISRYAADQIKKYYKREAKIINPPVDLKKFSTDKGLLSTKEGNVSGKSQENPQNKTEKSQTEQAVKNTTKPEKCQISPLENVGFITTSRQVVWKRLDLCVKACLETNQKLTIIGEGPEHDSLVKLAKNSDLISFLPKMSQEELGEYLRSAKAYLFPSKEPFGLAPVEALAAGCPVIALGEGGALDYVEAGKNGLLFEKQTVKSLAAAILEFENHRFSTEYVKNSATRFDKTVFVEKMSAEIEKLTEKTENEN